MYLNKVNEEDRCTLNHILPIVFFIHFFSIKVLKWRHAVSKNTRESKPIIKIHKDQPDMYIKNDKIDKKSRERERKKENEESISDNLFWFFFQKKFSSFFFSN